MIMFFTIWNCYTQLLWSVMKWHVTYKIFKNLKIYEVIQNVSIQSFFNSNFPFFFHWKYCFVLISLFFNFKLIFFQWFMGLLCYSSELPCNQNDVSCFWKYDLKNSFFFYILEVIEGMFACLQTLIRKKLKVGAHFRGRNNFSLTVNRVTLCTILLNFCAKVKYFIIL